MRAGFTSSWRRRSAGWGVLAIFAPWNDPDSVSLIALLALAGSAAAAGNACRAARPRRRAGRRARLIDEAEAKIHALHSFHARPARALAEGWWAPYAAELPHQMFSLSRVSPRRRWVSRLPRGNSPSRSRVKFFPDEAGARRQPPMRVPRSAHMAAGHTAWTSPVSPTTGGECREEVPGAAVTHKPHVLRLQHAASYMHTHGNRARTTGQSVLDYLRRGFSAARVESPRGRPARGVSMAASGCIHDRTEDNGVSGSSTCSAASGRAAARAGAWVEPRPLVMSNGSNPRAIGSRATVSVLAVPAWRHSGRRGTRPVLLVFPELDAVWRSPRTRDLQAC